MKISLIVFSILSGVILIGGTIIYSNRSNDSRMEPNNVTVSNGQQIIAINAKGGYFPRTSRAQAGLPTVIKVVTRSTFDCSSALSIPMLNYRANLPASGETLITVPPQAAGSTLRGVCAMGMYSFSINFN